MGQSFVFKGLQDETIQKGVCSRSSNAIDFCGSNNEACSCPTSKTPSSTTKAVNSERYQHHSQEYGHYNGRPHRPRIRSRAPIRSHICGVHKPHNRHLGQQPRVVDLVYLCRQLAKNVSRSAFGAQDHLPAAALRDGKRRGPVVERKTVSIRADSLGSPAVVRRFAEVRIMVLANTTLLVVSRCSTGTVAWREVRSPDLVVWIGVNAVSRLGGRKGQVRPRAPVAHTIIRFSGLERYRE